MARLIDMYPRHGAKDIMKKSGVISVCKLILEKEDQDDYIKSEAGSLVSLLTNLPVASNVSDQNTGSYASTES